MKRVRVFIACSLDGFIAGLDDDLSWLPPAPEDGSDHGYTAFMRSVGALLIGRRSYDVIAAFSGLWPYGPTPVLVATHRPLQPKVATVSAVSGDIGALVAQARAVAGGADVYLDGGALIRSALDAELVDDLTVTITPIMLGVGIPLFAGLSRRVSLTRMSAESLPSGLVQVRYSTRG